MAISSPEKTFILPLSIDCIKICPTCDLVAVIFDQAQTLNVYRLDGNLAFSHNCRRDQPISDATWHPNGERLAITYEDGAIDYVDAVTKNYERDTAGVSTATSNDQRDSRQKQRSRLHVSWSYHVIGDRHKCMMMEIDPDFELETDETDDSLDVANGYQKADCSATPNSLNNLRLPDLRTELPKLCSLPRVDDYRQLSLSDDQFSTSQKVESAFHREDEHAPALSALVQYQGDGHLGLRLFDGFDAGRYKICPSDPILDVVDGLRCTSHAIDDKISLIQTFRFSNPDNDEGGAIQRLYFTQLDLSPVKHAGSQLPYVAVALAELKALRQYTVYSCANVRNGFTQTQNLPQRFYNNANEALEEKHKVTLEIALYELANTLHCLPALEEWITDELGDRGINRITQDATTGFGTMIDAINNCLIPAVEKTLVTIKKLRALSRQPEIQASVLSSVEQRDFDRIERDLNNLTLISGAIRGHISTESKGFQKFSEWLKNNHKLLHAEPGGATRQDIVERISEANDSALMEYIESLRQSRLAFFLSHPTSKVSESIRRAGRQFPTVTVARILDRHKRENIQPDLSRSEPETVNLLYQALFLRDSVDALCDKVKDSLVNNCVKISPSHQFLSFHAKDGKPLNFSPFVDVRTDYDPSAQGKREGQNSLTVSCAVAVSDNIQIFTFPTPPPNQSSDQKPPQHTSTTVQDELPCLETPEFTAHTCTGLDYQARGVIRPYPEGFSESTHNLRVTALKFLSRSHLAALLDISETQDEGAGRAKGSRTDVVAMISVPVSDKSRTSDVKVLRKWHVTDESKRAKTLDARLGNESIEGFAVLEGDNFRHEGTDNRVGRIVIGFEKAWQTFTVVYEDGEFKC